MIVSGQRSACHAISDTDTRARRGTRARPDIWVSGLRQTITARGPELLSGEPPTRIRVMDQMLDQGSLSDDCGLEIVIAAYNDLAV